MLIAQKMRSFNYTISDNLEKRQENTMAFTVTRHRTREAAGLTPMFHCYSVGQTQVYLNKKVQLCLFLMSHQPSAEGTMSL